jgi:ribosomal protein S18 acetylase RimI-like enzyme
MSDLHIRPARAEDVAALVEELGQRRFFADRLERQASGRGLLLTAWQDDRPVGDVYLWLEPAEELEIRERLTGTPLLTHLEVHPALRQRGFGTELIRAAEHELADRGHDQVALAVEVTNHGAMRLYRRLGYEEWDHPPISCFALADDRGPRMVEICRVMVKQLHEHR